METIEILAPSGIYSKETVLRAAHRHSGSCFVEVSHEGDSYQIRLSPKSALLDASQVSIQVKSDLVDEALRESVRQQTGAIQELLLRAALMGAGGGER